MTSDVVCGLRELSRLTAPSHEIDLVLIPGIGTPSVDEWGLCLDPWQEQLRLLNTASRYLAFDHGILLDQRFEWQQLIDAGNQLQSDLVALCDADEADRRPLVLVSHSLGGLVLKQALNRLNVQATQNTHRYHRYFNRIAGIVFISTPHGSSSNLDVLSESCIFIVKQYAAGKLGSQTRAILKESISSSKGPLMIARRFDDIHIGVEVLSIYENLPTRRKTDYPWQKQKHYTIIDENLAQVGVPKEEIIGIPADHSDVCNLAESDGSLHSEAWRWLKDTIESAKPRVEDNFRSYISDDIRNPATPTLSIDTASVKGASSDIEVQQDSNKAQKGSPTFDSGLNTIFENFVPVINHLQLPCYMIDTFAQNKDFFGRKDILDAMDHALLPSKSMIASSEPGTIHSVVLLGPGGFGKTEIAVQFAFLRQDQFDAVFWIRAEDENKLDIDFRQMAVRLGLQKPGQAQDPVVTRSMVTEWLSNPRKVLNADDDSQIASRARWLLVFDNADNSELLQDYIKIYGSGSILVTSRDPNARELFWLSESFKVIDVDKFDSQEGLDFLNYHARKRTGTSDTLQAACREIVEHHDGHPLALAQIAGFIRHQYLSYTDILGYINDPTERKRLFDHNYGIRETARGTVPALVAIGISKLSKESKSLLELLCFLDPDRIQEHILSKSGRSQYYRARGPLLQSSLVRRNEDKNELWMHRVDQAAVKDGLDPVRRTEILAKAIELVKDSWPMVEMRRRHTVERWPLCEALYPHVVALQSSYTEFAVSWPLEVQINMAKLLQEAAWWQYERGNFKTAKPMADLVKPLCEKYTHDLQQRHLLSLVHDLLGCIANGTNNPKLSMDNNTQFLGLRKRIAAESGEMDELLAYAHNQMGCSYMMAKDYSRGAELFKEALRIWHELKSYKPGDASMEYANLGLSYFLQGQLDRASEILEEGHKERITGYGVDDTESFRPGRILYALGNVRAAQGRFEDSEKFHQRALITFQITIGNKYHRTADVSHKLAQHCMRRAKSGDSAALDTALKLVDQALSIWAANEAAYKPELTRTTFLKSKILAAKGSSDMAKPALSNAVLGYRSLVSGSLKGEHDLTEADFDELVTFWSR